MNELKLRDNCRKEFGLSSFRLVVSYSEMSRKAFLFDILFICVDDSVVVLPKTILSMK